MKTYLDVINETVEFYGADPKNRLSMDGPYCLYVGPDNKRCAFSRCCSEEHISFLIKKEGRQSDTILGKNDCPKDLLKSEYRHLCNPDFWTHLQSLHDNELNWNFTSGGLTAQGKKYVEFLQNKYCE